MDERDSSLPFLMASSDFGDAYAAFEQAEQDAAWFLSSRSILAFILDTAKFTTTSSPFPSQSSFGVWPLNDECGTVLCCFTKKAISRRTSAPAVIPRSRQADDAEDGLQRERFAGPVDGPEQEPFVAATRDPELIESEAGDAQEHQEKADHGTTDPQPPTQLQVLGLQVGHVLVEDVKRINVTEPAVGPVVGRRAWNPEVAHETDVAGVEDEFTKARVIDSTRARRGEAGVHLLKLGAGGAVSSSCTMVGYAHAKPVCFRACPDDRTAMYRMCSHVAGRTTGTRGLSGLFSDPHIVCLLDLIETYIW